MVRAFVELSDRLFRLSICVLIYCGLLLAQSVVGVTRSPIQKNPFTFDDIMRRENTGKVDVLN